ncbi:unnamed protein product [Fraxinus pennsylvanica]|uniref:Uncharacterized protein n=1 Tax=Fraxinus pennsylvanica TaxID=56036 RepID=A0AAD1ZRA3_9LAMI|nr:unnamed protein product [Fraxinus pennsylvanica]
MAGNPRFEMTLASPDSSFAGGYQNGPRGSYSGPSLNRSGSFREGAESRMLGSGKATSRGTAMSAGDVSSLSQCLMLEPIVMGDQKYPRSDELRRIIGSSVGNSSEDNSFGAVHLKTSPPVVMEELKRFRASFADTRLKASGRAKKLDEHLNKLNNYLETMTRKNQQRNELLTNDRSTSSSSKMGTQMQRSPSELVAHKFEDGPKNIVLNKRLRTSIVETRADFRDNGLLRQPLAMTKERDLLKDGGADADIVEERIRKLPAGGEGWDKKKRRKRSVAAVFSRAIDSDGELKRTMHHKLISEPGGGNKLDSIPSPAGSNSHATPKTEQERSVLSRDFHPGQNKERVLGKGNIKFNNSKENLGVCPSPVVKGKASRAPRSGSICGTNSASNIPRISGALEEQPQGVNKNPSIGSSNNRKRGIPTVSSSLPITHWVGQRPQKISRTRRTNLVPVSNHDEAQMQSEGCSPSDLGTRLGSGVTNVSLISRSTATGTHNFKVKPENVSSPARLSESEEFGAGENKLKDIGLGSVGVEEKDENGGQNIRSSAILTKKNKIVVKEKKGDGVQRQGQSGGVLPFSSPSISPMIDKAATTKPLRSARSGSDKNASKSGRLLKKLSDRKGLSRLVHVANGGSPDFSGESEDDREEILKAANFAYDSSVRACSSPFWKKVEALFASISPDERSYLSQQLKSAEEYSGSLNQIIGPGNNIQLEMGDHGHEEISASDSLFGERNGHMKSETGLKDSFDSVEFVQQLQDSSLLGSLDTGRTPLYQRILSAVIMEDEIEECKENGFRRSRSSPDDPRFVLGSESKNRSSNFSEPIVGIRTQKNGNPDQFFSCNGNTDLNRIRSARVHPCNSEMLQGDSGYEHLEVDMLSGRSRCDYGAQNFQSKSCGISFSDYQYDEMYLEDKLVLELQSVGLYSETMPPLDNKEDEVINHEIVQLESGLHQKIGKKKMCLDKFYKAIQEENDAERRNPEQVAMDKLVELAYQKFLATRGSFASKHEIAKVSKQSALAFAKRTLSRCQKFEDLGASCFTEPAIRDIVYAAPPRVNEPAPLPDANLSVANGSLLGCTNGSSADVFETSGHQSDHDFAKNGPISNRGKKKEVLLEYVGGAVFRSTPTLGISGDARGKRSERERETSTRNLASSSSMGGSKGERKTKAKPKQKTAQLSTSGNGFVNKRDIRSISSGNAPLDSSKETKKSMDFPNLPLDGVDSIEQLGVDSDIGGTQDFSSLFNFDEDGREFFHMLTLAAGSSFTACLVSNFGLDLQYYQEDIYSTCRIPNAWIWKKFSSSVCLTPCLPLRKGSSNAVFLLHIVYHILTMLRSSPDDLWFVLDSESKNRTPLNFSEPIVGIQTQKNGNPDQFSLAMEILTTNARVHACNSEMLQGEGEYERLEVDFFG